MLLLKRLNLKLYLKVVIPSTGCRRENILFSPPEESHGPMTKPFELGGLQIFLSAPKCQIVRGLHVAPTPVGQISEFGKNGLKALISL